MQEQEELHVCFFTHTVFCFLFFCEYRIERRWLAYL